MSDDRALIDTLEIFIDQIEEKYDLEKEKDENSFPKSFFVKFHTMEKNFSAEFERIPKDKTYPIASNKVYSLDSIGNVVEFDLKTNYEVNSIENFESFNQIKT